MRDDETTREQLLDRHIAFEKLILSLSNDFINLEADLIDSGINDALRNIGEFVGADRSYVFQFTDNGAHMTNTHEWCAPGIATAIQDLQDIPVDTALPWDLNAGIQWDGTVQGRPYDWKQLFTFLKAGRAALENEEAFFCSEFANAFYRKCGLHPFSRTYPSSAVSPGMFRASPHFTTVWTTLN